MLSARDGEALLAQAHAEDARVVLVGDVKQLGSVAAGRAFGQLQDAGMETPKLAEIVRQSNPDTRRAVEALLVGNAEAAFAALDDGGGEVICHADHNVRRARLARDFVRLSPRDRARTLALNPTREGRQALTDAIRAELVRDGTLGERAMTVTVRKSVGLTHAARARAASYRPGTVVIFCKGGEDGAPRRNTGYRVESVDAEGGTVRLLDSEGQALTWSPGDGSAANADAFTEAQQECRTGDKVQFTRNNDEAKRLNGRTAEVVACHPDEGILVAARGTASVRPSTWPTSPTATSDRAGSARSIPRKERRASASWRTSNRSAATSTPTSPTSPSPEPRLPRSSTPTTATASQVPSKDAAAPRSARSTRR